MSFSVFPSKADLTICFAHVAYDFAERFAARSTGLRHFQVRNRDGIDSRMHEADVLVVSMLWRDDLLESARKLRFIQSISAGTEQYDTALLQRSGIRLASAAGVNSRAVAQHAMAMILALARLIHTGRDNQNAKHWRPMISDIDQREDELGGKTLVIVGMGRIGSHLARIAKAFDMRVIGLKRDPATGVGAADAVYAQDRLLEWLPHADIVVLTCPLTPATENLIGARALGVMKPSAHLINVARGKVVDEEALTAALAERRIAAAGLDVMRQEPLSASSPLWSMRNVLLTPHTAGETRSYEDGVIDILLDNLDRLWRGETLLRNQVV